MRRLAASLLDPEEVEPFVVLVVAARNRGEIVPPATRQTRRRTEFRFGAATATSGPSPRGAALALRLRSLRGRLASSARGTRRRTFPVAPSPSSASACFPFAGAVGSGAGRNGSPAVAGGERFVVSGVIATAHRGRFVTGLFRGGTFVAGPFAAATTAATTTAAAAATAGLLVASVATRFTIDRGPVSPAAGLACRLTGIQVDAPPIVVVAFGLPGRRPIAAMGAGWGSSPFARCIPIKTGRGSRWLATRRLAAGFAVPVSGRPTFAVVLTSRGSRTPLLTGGLLDRLPRLEAELIVGAVIGLRSASRSSVVGPARCRLVPRCVVAIPPATSPTTTASAAATATSRLTAGAVSLGAIAILENPAFGRIAVYDQIVLFAPTGSAFLAPWGRRGRIAAARRPERVWAWLVGSGVGRPLGAGPIPGRAPRFPLWRAFAPPAVTAASAARGLSAVPSPVAAAFVASATGGWTVGGATVG